MAEPIPLDRVALAVLAGGAGSRMGHPKDRVRLGGAPALEHLHQRIDWPGPTLLVVARPGERPEGSEWFGRVTSDERPGLGPVSGILAALRGAETEWVIVTPLDMPAIGRQHLAWVCERASHEAEFSALLLEREELGRRRIESFPSLFRSAAAGAIGEYLARSERSVHGLAMLAGVRVVPVPPGWGDDVWTNLNTPADVARWHEGRGPDASRVP